MKAQEKMNEGSPEPTAMSTSEDNTQYADTLMTQEETCNNEELNLDMSNIYRKYRLTIPICCINLVYDCMNRIELIYVN